MDLLEGICAPMSAGGVSGGEIFASVFNFHGGVKTIEERINLALYFEAKTFLQGLLIVEDKLGMAHSLETRVPFLDNDVVDFAQKVPLHMKLGDMSNRTNFFVDENTYFKKLIRKRSDGKKILRQAMTKYLPESIVYADKQGFSAPDASWFKGESIDYVSDTLFNNNAKIYNHLDRGGVQALISEHLEGKVNHRLLIWSLIYLEKWFCIF